MTVPNRDLRITIDGDAAGFDAACQTAEERARGLDRSLIELERQQNATAAVTARTAAVTKQFGDATDRAGLQARKMGLEVEQAAQRAEKAQVRAAAAADAYSKGLISEAKAATLAAQADNATERAALKAAEAQIAAAEAAKKRADEEAKAAAAAEKAKEANVQVTSGLVSLITAGVALTPAMAAAGGAFVAFAAVAAPSVIKVVKAQTDLAANWGGLDKQQRATASGLSLLVEQYKALAKSYEPDALRLFNGLIGTTRGLLPDLTKTIDATKGSVAGFASQVENTLGAQVPRLFAVIRDQGGPALHELGTTFDQTATLAVSLVHDLAPLAQTLLTSANGVLRLLNAVERIDPRLAEFATVAVALRAPTQALSNLWVSGAEKLSGWGKKAEDAESKVGGLAKGAAKAEGTVGKLGETMGSSPNLYIGAALAITYLVTRLATMKTATDNLVDSIRTENNAFGNNIAGHQAAAASYAHLAQQAREAQKAALEGQAVYEGSNAIDGYNAKIRTLTQAQREEEKAARNVAAGEKQIMALYGGSADQAGQLATAAGVDLSQSMDKSGKLTDAAAAKIRAYQQAVQAAQDPTYVVSESLKTAGNNALALKDRMNALTNAFSALAGPELQAFDATTKAAQAFSDLDKAMKASHGSMDLSTDKGKAARTAFVGLVGSLQQSIDAQYQYEQTTKGVSVAMQNRTAKVRELLPLLLAETHGNDDATRAVLDWANSAGVGKTRGEALAGALGTSKDAFIKAAVAAGESKGAAEKLWASFQKLQTPLKLSVNDAEFLSKLHTAQGLKIDPKTGLLLGNGSNYFDAWLKAKGLRLDPKTGLFLGNNSDYYNKWLKANGLRIDPKTGVIKGNTDAFWSAVNSIPSVVAHRQINVTYVPTNTANQPGTTRHASGGIIHRADGGPIQHMAVGGPSGPVVGIGTATSDSIVTALSNGEYVINAARTSQFRSLLDVINYGTAALPVGVVIGGTVGGGAAPVPTVSAAPATSSTNPLDLSSVFSYYQSAAHPATKSQYDSALKARRTAVDRLKSAEDALYRAEHARHRNSRSIAAAERRIAAARSGLADATAKLTDVENRYNYAKKSPAAQLDAALSLGIKDNVAFIRNLQTLADRGFGDLAQRLLALGGPQAEKIAADAAKFSTSKLKSLQGKITQEQSQQDYLANLPAILAVRSAIHNTKGGISSFTALLEATGLAGGPLADALKLMASDLQKTPSGRALLADMHAHGYARGGLITGPGGVDAVPMWGTAGEYVVNARATAANRALLDAINYSPVRVPVALPVRGGDGAAVGATIHQHFEMTPMDVHQLAREAAREAAWTLKG